MSITTDLRAFNEHYSQLEEFKRILPDPEDVILEDGRYYVQAEIPARTIYDGDYQQYLKYVWIELYRKMTTKIARAMMGFQGYLVLKIEPMVMANLDGWRVALVSDMSFAKERNVVIPTFVYDEHNHIVEWRCGNCGMPNPIEAHYCGQTMEPAGCGAPRTLLAQELR